MDDQRYARWGAAGGIVSVVMLVVGFGLITKDAPAIDASAKAWAALYSDHATRIQIGVTVVGAGIVFFLWFLGTLRSTIAAFEAGRARLASIAFAGGLVGVATLLVTLTATATAAFRPDELDPSVTRAINDFGALAAGPGAAGLTALFAATAIAGYRHGALPAPVAGFSALAAITQPLAFGVVFCTSGAFAADGVLGLVVPIVTFAIAIVTASWALMRR